MKARYLIAADGMSRPNHLSDRHFIVLEGEPLLQRTVRQFSEHGHVIVIAPPEYGERLDARIVQSTRREDKWYGNDMIAKSRPWWAWNRRTVLLFGDVWYSDEAVAAITGFEDRDFQMFGRRSKSLLTGTPWGEPFAFSFWPEHQDKMMEALRTVSQKYKNGQWHRATPWEFYYEMEGMDWKIPAYWWVPIGPHWTNINDWTDDFDFDGEAERWKARRAYIG